MQGFISTSSLLLAVLLASSYAQADEIIDPKSPTEMSEEEDFEETPFTKYGEFDEDEDEAENTRFFEFGRFFGVSLGGGIHGAAGNRGLLWKGGFPLAEFMVHYWFDFNVGLQMYASVTSHFQDAEGSSNRVSISLIPVGIDVKYYFNTADLSSALTFAHPHILAGGGSYTKNEVDADGGTVDETTFGFDIGGGLEFPISYKKSYFYIQGKAQFVNFVDTNTSDFESIGIPDLTGVLWAFAGGLMFTW